ncbi:hypothetical protein DCM91_00115 [Chitinophaga costaii]|nr:hypothetical protein DCM91_00115 [Chitinophaga costaii]
MLLPEISSGKIHFHYIYGCAEVGRMYSVQNIRQVYCFAAVQLHIPLHKALQTLPGNLKTLFIKWLVFS